MYRARINPIVSAKWEPTHGSARRRAFQHDVYDDEPKIEPQTSSPLPREKAENGTTQHVQSEKAENGTTQHV